MQSPAQRRPRLAPTITTWNRLEGRPRTADFDRALKAEVRDALWLLSRQWQLAEFQGDDAGSPVLARLHLRTTALTTYQPGTGAARALPAQVPLEVMVEHQPVAFSLLRQPAALDIRLLMGRQWLKLLARALPAEVLAPARAAYLARYPVARPSPEAPADAPLCAHVGTWQQFAATAGRSLNGYQLYAYLRADAAHHAADGIEALGAAPEQATVGALAQRFVAWFEQLYYQPGTQGNPAWQPAYLEHQFACSAPQGLAEKVLVAEAYHQGHLDWYSLDIDQSHPALGVGLASAPDPAVEKATTFSFIPTGITFAGMPHTRWWELEDSRTSFGDIRPDTTDLNKLLLLDFGLLYANDWFSVPLTLPVGSLASVAGLSVTNVFGERFWVEAAGRGADQDWQRWSMYTLSTRGDQPVAADTSLLLLPAVAKVLAAKPSEQVYLLRDEVANMVWGVEARVPLASGGSQPGKEAAHELQARLQQLVPPGSAPALLPNDASSRYQIVNSVPEHWIPFVPVQVPGSNREIQLQRAALPRLLAGDTRPPSKVEPRTTLLRAGLDQAVPLPYYVHEEEVPRAGTLVTKAFQRTRWMNGQVYTWIGLRKQTGRGEGASGLAFDQLIPLKK